MDDIERARFLGLPSGCRMRENAKIISPDKLEIGENVWIGEGAVLDASGGLSIGAETQIGLYALIWSHTSHLQAMAGETGSSRQGIVRAATSIGERCFIGGPSVIAPGVTIGDRVIVSPFSLVSEDLPDGTVYNEQHRVKRLERRIAKLESVLEQRSDG